MMPWMLRVTTALLLVLGSTQAAAQFESFELDRGFKPDPRIGSGTSGGRMDASEHGRTDHGRCRGMIDARANHTIYLSRAFDYLRVKLVSSGPVSLVVRGPDGYRCNDDAGEPGPTIEGEWPAGMYQVFVGSLDDGDHEYSIAVTEVSPDYGRLHVPRPDPPAPVVSEPPAPRPEPRREVARRDPTPEPEPEPRRPEPEPEPEPRRPEPEPRRPEPEPRRPEPEPEPRRPEPEPEPRRPEPEPEPEYSVWDELTDDEAEPEKEGFWRRVTGVFRRDSDSSPADEPRPAETRRAEPRQEERPAAAAPPPQDGPQRLDTDFLDLDLAPGFEPNPTVVTGIAGGMVNAASLGSTSYGECGGGIDEQPDHMMIIRGDFEMLRLHVRSDGDTSLVIRGPDGVRCNMESDGHNPIIQGRWTPGRYEIFVGSVDGRLNRYSLTVTEF